MKKNEKKSGFTLVELMVVLAILVLLVAMVGPRLLGSQKKADVKATVQQIKNLESSLKLYVVDNRSYPSSEEGLAVLLQRPQDEQRALKWEGPYLDADALPIDPWGNAYRYEFPPTHGRRSDKPNIWSAGADGQDDTEDDITNWTKGSEESGELIEPDLGADTGGAASTL